MKNSLLKGLLMFGALICFGMTQAQTVTGTVSDANGPLAGANVIVKGTTNGTQTDFDGNYTLNNVATNAVLVFSYVGFKTQEIAVNGRTTINVTLVEDASQLDEVVIIGYGQTTVKDATGAVTSVTSEDFNRGVIASPEQLIQGKTAGVQITQTSGEPGAGIAIRIRGTNSVRSNNNPLFVVDGVPLAGDDTSSEGTDIGFGTSSARNPLNFLNPNDIESISILKDASATAIYGSRGANGVVIITTKSGKAGAGGVWELSSSLSYSEPAEEFNLLSAEDYLSESARLGLNVAERSFGGNTDWQSIVTRSTASQNHNLSYSNNYGKGSVRATLGYGEQFGVIQNSSLERITGRVNAIHRFLDDRLKLNLQASLSRVNDESPPLSGSAGFRGDLLGAAYSANPTWPTDPDFDGTGGLLSPATLLAYTQSTTNTNRLLLNFSAEYDFTSELVGKVNFGYDESDSSRGSVASALARNFDQGTFGNGSGAINEIDARNRLLEATLTYNKEFENSNLEALVGYSFQDFNRSGRNINGWGFATQDLNQMVNDLARAANLIEDSIDGSYQQYGFATNLTDVFVNRLFPNPVTDNIAAPDNLRIQSIFTDTFNNKDELQSFFARVNYTIADKYLFTGTIRADGSSRFGDNNRYGYFPSGAFAWKLSEEDFVGDAFSTLKLRLGFGITGNQEGLGFGNFVRRERFTGGDVINDGGEIPNIPGIAAAAFANPDLKWEETLQYSAGVDFGFFGDRLNGSIDVYRKETTDLLFRVFSAQPAVQPFVFLNLPGSKVVNEGIEFAINYDVVRSEDFNWDVSFNIAYNDNVIDELDGEFDAGTIRGQGLSLAFAQKLQEGQPLFSFFLREFEGFDTTTGQPIQEDVQRFVGKSALPDITTGFSTNFSYKNWSLSAFFSGQFGHYIYNNTANAFFTAGAFRGGRNVTPDVLTSGESLDAAADVSTRFLESGDFVRLQNASLTYNVPLSGEGAIKSLRLSLTGQNLFVITDYSGLDPEVSVSPGSGDLLNGLPVFGIDYTSFPRPRTITFGLNATF
ncbi:SusC/RagA family TonB-linked outer membrane protein [Leptobacterium flavescens]|uniref:SusC/RagA family TonB-linked outer membrane protein n=1 Tax=Leptobacterium flavescens TaxID=472055 RepID=A0A6P0UMZ6_9FLAO|nr:SusC/RagA family TonB-linked outer membrane protein [Leptobacterium flavescens]NER14644.1 SusC/RagA family TonB-linked outer membrane protein [Leptobacterium flavescens]